MRMEFPQKEKQLPESVILGNKQAWDKKDFVSNLGEKFFFLSGAKGLRQGNFWSLSDIGMSVLGEHNRHRTNKGESSAPSGGHQ